MRMDTFHLRAFRLDFAKAVETLEKQYDVKIGLGTIRYDPTNFRTTLTVTNKVEVGAGENVVEVSSAIPEKYRKYATVPFKHNNKTYLLVDWHSRRPKYPAIAKRLSDGKKFKLPSWALPIS